MSVTSNRVVLFTTLFAAFASIHGVAEIPLSRSNGPRIFQPPRLTLDRQSSRSAIPLGAVLMIAAPPFVFSESP